MLTHASREHQSIDATERCRHGTDGLPDAVHIHVDARRASACCGIAARTWRMSDETPETSSKPEAELSA